MKEIVKPQYMLPPRAIVDEEIEAAKREWLRDTDAHERAVYNIREGYTDVEEVIEFVDNLVDEHFKKGYNFRHNNVVAFIATVFEDLEDDQSRRWLCSLSKLNSQKLASAERIAGVCLDKRLQRETEGVLS